MELKDIIPQLFSTLFVFRDNVHNLHINCKWTGAMYYHKYLWEIYQRADDQLDRIMERGRFWDIDTPTQYAEIQIASKLEAYPTIEKDVNLQKKIMKQDMDYLEWFLKVWEEASIKFDGVVNTKIIDFRDQLGTYIYLNNLELGV